MIEPDYMHAARLDPEVFASGWMWMQSAYVFSVSD